MSDESAKKGMEVRTKLFGEKAAQDGDKFQLCLGVQTAIQVVQQEELRARLAVQDSQNPKDKERSLAGKLRWDRVRTHAVEQQ